MILRFLLMLLFLAALFGGIATLKMNQIKALQTKFEVPPAPSMVETSTVKEDTWVRTLKTVGAISAVQAVEVASEVSGLVTAIKFRSGETVTPRQVLVELDASVDVAELNGLIAERRLAEVQFERMARLLKDRTVSQSQYDEAAARREEIVAAVRAKKAQIAKKTIRAPFAGTLGLRRVDIGDFVQPGTAMVTLQMLKPIYVDYAVPERYLRAIAVGQEVTLSVQAYPGDVFQGRVKALEPNIDPNTRNVRVRAELANGDERLRPGMFAEVSTIGEQHDRVITVPEIAVNYTPYGSSVFVVEGTAESLTATRRQIETAGVRDGRVAVTKGLDVDDLVVTAGHNKLRNGMPVRLKSGAEPSLTGPIE